MNYPSNSAFNQTVKGLMIGASIVTQVSGSTEVEAGYYKSLSQYNMGSTKPREDYSPISKSSVQNVTIFSNQNAVMEYEKTIIFQEIHNKLQAKVKKHWIPNNILNEKTCLFVQCDVQDNFKTFDEFDQFEAALYTELKATLATTQHFNMIALI